MRVNREIRASRVRVIDKDGNQLGVLTLLDAIHRAEQVGLDLVEIAPTADPPVCKIIDFGKYRYQQTKKEKESKKSQHQVKVKEIKVKPNTDEHDLLTKLRHARKFIEEGNKVKITCNFRGREMMHSEFGKKVVDRMCNDMSDIATPESSPKFFGKTLSVVLAPGAKKNREKGSHMPKMKPRKAMLARFKVTGTGKLKRRRPGRRHLLTGKAAKRKRKLRKATLVDNSQTKMYARLMGV